VLARLPNPTYDYYLASRLMAEGMPPFEIFDTRCLGQLPTDPSGAFVLICRYPPPEALAWIEQNAAQLSGVGLFIDDDIAAVVAGEEAKIGYRARLFFRALWPLLRLNRHLDIVWVSTPELVKRMNNGNCALLPPAPPERLFSNKNSRSAQPGVKNGKGVKIAYHATAIHSREHDFLRPVIEQVLELRPQAKFEVFADRHTAAVWQAMDRVAIRNPLSWPDYLADAAINSLDIMLVPLAPSRVNDCRADTKRIDVARYGAAGIFSSSHAYGSSESSGEIILPYDESRWRNAILLLIDNDALRKATADATMKIVRTMADFAASGIEIFVHK
jgi:hypothetical protein